MTDLPVKLKMRIDWSEQDLFRHVNNVAFVKYVQAARVNYWEQIGLYQQFLKTNIGPILASVSCSYKKPLFYPGEIVVHTGLKFIGHSSFGFIHRIYDHENDLCAEAEDVMVMYDFHKQEKVLFPEDLKKKAEKLEGKSF